MSLFDRRNWLDWKLESRLSAMTRRITMPQCPVDAQRIQEQTPSLASPGELITIHSTTGALPEGCPTASRERCGRAIASLARGPSGVCVRDDNSQR